MKIKFSSQRREMLLFWTTNTAVVTSRATSNWALSESHVVNIVAVYMMMSIDRLCANKALFSWFFNQWCTKQETKSIKMPSQCKRARSSPRDLKLDVL